MRIIILKAAKSERLSISKIQCVTAAYKLPLDLDRYGSRMFSKMHKL